MTLQKPTMPLGGCPRIAIFSKIEECPKKLPQAYSRYSEDNFFGYDEEFGEKGILGQPPSRIPADRGDRRCPWGS